MSNYGNNQIILAAPELAAVMTGAAVKIGTLLFNPFQLIFDNQGTASVAISTDGGTTTWRTFPAGEALVLDNQLGTFSIGTVFTGTGASGTFSVSYTYAKL